MNSHGVKDHQATTGYVPNCDRGHHDNKKKFKKCWGKF